MTREQKKKMIVQWYDEYFRNGKLETLPKYVHENYTQHLFFLPDGRNSINVFMELQGGKFPTEVKRLIGDDELLAIHFQCNGPADPNHEFAGKKLAVVDIFRMKDNLFCEHWGVVQPVLPTVSGHDMFSDVLKPRIDVTRKQENANRELVRQAFTGAFNGDVKGFSRYMSNDPYIEHSPNVPKDTRNLFEAYQMHYGSPEPPKGRVVRMIAEGDVVLVHNLYVYPGNKEIVSVELVRVWDDKFVEHWDIQEPVPPPEMFKNKNGMY